MSPPKSGYIKVYDNEHSDSPSSSSSDTESIGPEKDIDAAQSEKLHILQKLGHSKAAYATAIFLLLALILYGISSSIDSTAVSITNLNCGNTSSEAKSRGCILDLISRAWSVPECYDAELSGQFAALSDWHWYADSKGENEISEADIRDGVGPDPIFVTQEYHLHHCAFMWRKMHRAIEQNWPIDDYIGAYHHTEHCVNFLVNQGSNLTISASPFFFVFPNCPVKRV